MRDGFLMIKEVSFFVCVCVCVRVGGGVDGESARQQE